MNSWGPSHNPNPPVRFGRPTESKYWWAIAVGCVLSAAAAALDRGFGTLAFFALVQSAAAAGVGAAERRGGRRLASGQYVPFGIAAFFSLPYWMLPTLAYLGGYYGLAGLRSRAQAGPLGSIGRPVAAPLAAAAPAVTGPVPVIAGAYLGRADNGRDVIASPRGGVVIIGGPGSGKTQQLLNSVAYAAGPVLCSSMKAEMLVEALAARQQRGTVWVFDPGGDELPHGAKVLRWNPLCDVADWDSAQRVAGRLAAPARQGSSGDGHWVDRAESWLAVLLFAAKLAANPNGDLSALARWSINPAAGGEDVEAMLLYEADNGRHPEGADLALTVLGSLLAVPDKERESIASTVARIMRIYTGSAALKAGQNPNFDPAEFVRSEGDSVFLIAPVDRAQVLAPVLVAFLESVRFAQYARHQRVQLGRETQDAPVTWVLDEVTNAATAATPIPSIASEAGGQGLHLVCAFQDLSQARARWGEAASGLLSLFPERLVLPGLADQATGELLSKMSGEYDRMTVSASQQQTRKPGVRGKLGGTNYQGPTYSYQTSRTPVLSVADITGVPTGKALYWGRGGWQLINQTPWWQQRKRYGV